MAELRDLVRDADASRPIALLLPGSGYSTQAPLLYWSAEALHELGWRVMAMDWDAAIRENPRECIGAALLAAFEELGTEPELIVAKSIGTHAAPTAVARDIPGVWLTPLLTEPSIVDALGRAGSDHLAIGGTADGYWQPTKLAGTGIELVSIDGATHSLETPGGWRDSLTGQTPVIEAVAAHASRLQASGRIG